MSLPFIVVLLIAIVLVGLIIRNIILSEQSNQSTNTAQPLLVLRTKNYFFNQNFK